MKTRTSKTLGAAAGIAAIVASVPLAITANVPLAITANADDPTPVTTPANPIPDLQGPGCDAFRDAQPNWKDFNSKPIGTVLASIPDISTFNSLVSGQANPAVNIVEVLNNGPYVVFAPTNDAFAAMTPASTPSRPTRRRCTSSTTTTSSSACSVSTTCTVSGPPSRALRSR